MQRDRLTIHVCILTTAEADQESCQGKELPVWGKSLCRFHDDGEQGETVDDMASAELGCQLTPHPLINGLAYN